MNEDDHHSPNPPPFKTGEFPYPPLQNYSTTDLGNRSKSILIMKYALLQVQKIETLHSDKANCDFKKVTFKGIQLIGNKEVKTNVQGTRNLWPTHTVKLADGSTTEIRGDVDYDNIMLGDLFAGNVHAFQTTPYQLEGRTINQYKCVVFESENPLAVAARNLRQNNAAPLDEEGRAYTVISQSVRKTDVIVDDKGTEGGAGEENKEPVNVGAGEGTNDEP
jgi:hypothetical protein